MDSVKIAIQIEGKTLSIMNFLTKVKLYDGTQTYIRDVEPTPENIEDEITKAFGEVEAYWQIIDEEKLTEEEKQYDLNNDGILDEQEKAKLEEDKLLNNPGISAWRKKKLRDYLEGRTKRYF
jgi:hypothetical protein